MSWQSCTAANNLQFESIIHAADDSFKRGEIVEVKFREVSLSRIDAMRALQHHWYNELSTQTGKSAMYMNAYCKLVFGVPIARENEEFKTIYDQVIKHLPQSKKIYLMAHLYLSR